MHSQRKGKGSKVSQGSWEGSRDVGVGGEKTEKGKGKGGVCELVKN